MGPDQPSARTPSQLRAMDVRRRLPGRFGTGLASSHAPGPLGPFMGSGRLVQESSLTSRWPRLLEDRSSRSFTVKQQDARNNAQIKFTRLYVPKQMRIR